ncbi:hypothetical protein G9U51_09750 [Calidifontibacter sp. DB0510]|uniref:Uncharacterized protein n=1 Tax=Metallococcus carri TaxID=1656884 RepID=A0A967EH91_9MICO|nr:hypothetical protein [Metallococcus carri]NHN56058.1 hypothetical protein [Metallococcus carri]NOP37485.1 hypothetical protein [Calidifontibacter sp. DB2511S]
MSFTVVGVPPAAGHFAPLLVRSVVGGSDLVAARDEGKGDSAYVGGATSRPPQPAVTAKATTATRACGIAARRTRQP